MKKVRIGKEQAMKELTEITLKEMVDVLSEYDFVLLDGPMENFHGYCDGERKKIYVHADQTPNQLARTIFHEFAHAYHFKHGLKDTEAAAKRVEKRTWDKYK